MTAPDFAPLRTDAREIRKTFLRMHFRANAGHVGTGLSTIELLTYLHRAWLTPDDVFVLSKGHGASALYATLNRVGRMSDETLATYYADGTKLAAHPVAGAHPGIPVATGSLGHGFPVAGGIAYAHAKMLGSGARIVSLLSDGECNEGSIWEAVIFAAHHKLSNLVAIVDANGLQGFGHTRDVLDMEPMAEKWRVFGFEAREIDGHDFAAIHAALADRPASKPLAIIARTVKGKGVRPIEGKLASHYLPLTEEHLRESLAALDADEEGR